MRKLSRMIFGLLAVPLWVMGCAAFQSNLYAQADVQRGTPQREGRAWVEHDTCSATVRDGGRLVVRADFGSVSVKPGPSSRMNCRINLRSFRAGEEEARRSFRGYEVGIRTLDNGSVMLIGRATGPQNHNGLAVDYQFTVPMKFNVDLETNGGDLNVAALDGEFRGVTQGGDISSGEVSGPVHVLTSGGDIRLGNIGQTLEARTAGGDIRLQDVKGDANLQTSGGEIIAGTISGSVNAQSAGGDIVMRGAAGPVRAETAGGQIQIGQCQNSVRAETAGGNILLHGARGLVVAQTAGGAIDLFRMESAVRAQTAAGPILVELNANRDSFAASQLETAVGDIQVFVPPDLPMNIDAAIAQAMGHQIVSDFPIQIQHAEEAYQRAKRAEATLNGGGKVLRIRVETGNIEIRKLNEELQKKLNMQQEAFWKLWKDRLQQVSHKDDNQ
ncbi:MAG: DUF4097 family beta strand repeat-containing protein [Deltaproteobacteria bacterium]